MDIYVKRSHSGSYDIRVISRSVAGLIWELMMASYLKISGRVSMASHDRIV